MIEKAKILISREKWKYRSKIIENTNFYGHFLMNK